jgi:hypothetical protein
MTLTIELPAELEKELAAAANEAGMTLAEYTLQLLEMGLAPGARVGSGAQLVAYWRKLNLIGTRAGIDDSQAHARRLREAAEHHYRSVTALSLLQPYQR